MARACGHNTLSGFAVTISPAGIEILADLAGIAWCGAGG